MVYIGVMVVEERFNRTNMNGIACFIRLHIPSCVPTRKRSTFFFPSVLHVYGFETEMIEVTSNELEGWEVRYCPRLGETNSEGVDIGVEGICNLAMLYQSSPFLLPALVRVLRGCLEFHALSYSFSLHPVKKAMHSSCDTRLREGKNKKTREM